MARWLMAVAFFAALAGVGWLWSARGRAAVEEAPVLARTRPAAQASLAAPLAAPELGPTAMPEEPARRELVRDASEGEAAASSAGERGDDLRVRVVDREGRPRADVTLTLEVPAGGSGRHHGSVTTGGDGRASFAAARSELQNAVTAWTLRHELLALEPPRLTLARELLAAPEVVSVLPAGGALDVVVRDHDGGRAPEGSVVKLRLVPADERANPVLSGREWNAEPRAGAASFEWVELGRTWEVRAWRPNGTQPSSVRARGPSAAGERVRVELVLGEGQPLVSFRALDEAGRPLASAALELARKQTFGFVESATLQTDTAGRFTIDGAETLFDSGSLLVTHTTAAGRMLRGRARVPDSLAPGLRDGGDVTLLGKRILCAGRVLDTSGRPVARASVLAGGAMRRRWSSEDPIQGECDEQGRFELHGLLHEEEFEVRAFGMGQLRSEPRHVREGQRDVELVLTPHHMLSGRLALDPGIDPGVIGFELAAPGAEPAPIERRLEHMRAAFGPNDFGGREVFRLEPVAAGEYTLLFTLEEAVLARVAVTLREDTDVGTIDLRGKIHACEIALLGAPPRLEGALVWHARGSGERHEARIEHGFGKLLTPTVPIDVVVRPRGYRHVLLENVSGRREVVLEPGLRVRIVLRTDGELPAPPYLLGCELRQDDESVSEPAGMRYFTAENREIELLVSAAGPLRLQWNLERRMDGPNFGGATGSGVLDEHARTLDVLDVPGEQRFEVELDGAALTALARDPPW